MENKLTRESFFLSLLIPIVVLLVGAIIIYQFNVFEFDPDEGINLMKASLLKHNYRLYTEVWNDQPPLLTYILAFVFNIFGEKVNFARTVILLFAAILAWENWLILYFWGGKLAAFIGSLLLLVAPNYLRLSVSVMIGLPAIVLAMTAILTIIIWHEGKQNIWLIASAIFLSLSILTKLFTLFLAPIIVAGILIDSWSGGSRQLNLASWYQKLQPAILWCLVFSGLTLILIGLLVGYNNIYFLIDNHSDARNLAAFENLSLDDAIRANYRVFLFGLSGLGILFAVRQQQWQAFYFLAWFLVSFFLLQQHRPVWYHHSILVYLPAIALVGYALKEVIVKFIQLLTAKKTSPKKTVIAFSIIVFITSILMIGEHTKTTFKKIESWQNMGIGYRQTNSLERQFITEIAQQSSSTNWMITDSPIFAFRSGLIVPPSLAVVSSKQLETGKLTGRELLDAIAQYQPEQILFKRFDWSKITPTIQQNYDLKRQDGMFELYWRKDIKRAEFFFK